MEEADKVLNPAGRSMMDGTSELFLAAVALCAAWETAARSASDCCMEAVAVQGNSRNTRRAQYEIGNNATMVVGMVMRATRKRAHSCTCDFD